VIGLTNCIDDQYDLSNGLNTDISIGGDSLSFPIGQSTKTFLSAMLNENDIEMLKKMADSTYSLQVKDSMQVNLNSLKPVVFSIAPITVAPITTSFTEIKIPEFKFDPISIESTIATPSITVDTKLIKPISSSYTQKYLISNYDNPVKSSSGNDIVGPYRKSVSQVSNQSFEYAFAAELNKINKISLQNCKVTMTFDKTKTNQLGLLSQNDTIKSLRINFPSEFNISTPVGLNSRIEGNSFIIENAALAQNVNIFTCSFYIQSLDLSSYPQNKSLVFNKDITYSIDYKFIGEIGSLSTIANRDVEYKVSLSATPIIDDMEIALNPFATTIPSGSYAINKVIQDIPKDVSYLSNVSFNTGAYLQLSIANPGIAPFSFTSGNCKVELPKSFIFKPFSGLNTSTNVLTIPYNELFTVKNIGIAGVSINQSIPEGVTSISVSDNLKYDILGFVVGAENTTLNFLKTINSKKIKMTGTCVGLTVNDAALTTRRISVDLPDKSSNIVINKFVSTDVKRIYSATLKNPASLQFKISISKLPTTIDSLFFENYTIQLPSSLRFKDGNVNMNNEVILNRGFKVSDGFVKVLTLEGFNFGNDGIFLENGTFKLSSAVSMKGRVYIKGNNLNTKDLGVVEVKPSIVMGEIDLAVIEAEVAPTIKPISKTVALNIPDFLKQEGSKLDLKNPVVTLEIGNTMGIPVDLAFNLTPRRNGVAIPNVSISSQIAIAQAQVLGQSTWSNYWISKANEGVSASFQPLIIPTLPNLFKIMPDEMVIDVTPTITGTRQKIDLYAAKNEINVKYSINVPLDFGEEFKIQYNDTITGIKDKLDELTKYTNQLDLIAIIDNQIPMDLNFEVIPLDYANHIISGVKITTSDSIKSCNIDGTAQKSLINLNISETAEGSLKQLTSMVLKVSASKNSTIAGMPLKSNQYFTIDLRMKIPNGITITNK
jgi:hypothetical protein